MLKAKASSLILIWSSWCRACAHAVSLVLNALPSATALKLKLLNFDASYRSLVKLGVKHLPIMLLFWGDRPVAVKVGSLTAQILSEWLLSKLE